MGRMTWGSTEGWRRVWIVVSVLWAVVVLFNAADWMPDQAGSRSYFMPLQELAVYEDPETAQTKIRYNKDSMARAEAACVTDVEIVAADPARYEEQGWDEREGPVCLQWSDVGERAMWHFILAASLPLGLLAAWLVGRWVRTGFATA